MSPLPVNLPVVLRYGDVLSLLVASERDNARFEENMNEWADVVAQHRALRDRVYAAIDEATKR
jgi:hypothetical protein